MTQINQCDEITDSPQKLTKKAEDSGYETGILSERAKPHTPVSVRVSVVKD